MALCHNCNDVRIEYIGNSSQVDYTFPFEYNVKEDVAVAYWNADFQVWEPQSTGWGFLNDTTLRFDEAPETDQKLIIYRCTDLTPLPAEFYPGTAIKGQDLNDNFFVLQSAIEEARCAIVRQDEKAEEKYWNKVPYEDVISGINPDYGDTIYSTNPWVCTDEAVASTSAICDKIEEELDITKVTEKEQREGDWIKDGENDDDDHFATTGAISERLDPFFQSELPPDQPYQIPGKLWFSAEEVLTRVWDQENKTWVTSGLSGPVGPIGPEGTYSTIVSDSAPTRRVNNTELQNGDIWFSSDLGELFIWYDDKQPDGPRGKQWIQVSGGHNIGGGGGGGIPEAPTDGQVYGRKDLNWEPITDNGGPTYNFIRPLVEDGTSVKIDLQLLNNA
jgi:hypothetical protein